MFNNCTVNQVSLMQNLILTSLVDLQSVFQIQVLWSDQHHEMSFSVIGSAVNTPDAKQHQSLL